MIDGFLRFHPSWGDLQTTRPDNPGAGNDFTYLFPDNFVYRPQTLRFSFTADGGGLTRQPYFCYCDSIGIIMREYSDITVGVGVTRHFNYQFTIAVSPDHLTVDNVHASAPLVMLTGGYNIIFTWTNKQAGDTITDVIFNYVQWRIK